MDYEDIFRFAPDKNAFNRAKKQATTGLWRDLQSNGKITWGNSKSSGASYYKTCFEQKKAEKLKFYCNCPSRKKPCKHSLALALLLQDQSGAFRITELIPDWVKEGLTQKKYQATAAELVEQEKSKAINKEKNRTQRLEMMRAGVQQLDLWLEDILQQGLARTEEQGSKIWEQLAARLTDAKLRGLGNRVLKIASFDNSPNKYEEILSELSSIYLLGKGLQNAAKLPQSLTEDVLTNCGINYKREDLIEQTTVKDTWLVVGQKEHTADERLYERRTWLYGEKTKRTGLFLDFAFQTEKYKEEWQVGHIYEAEMIFHPSAYPIRMFAKNHHRVDVPIEWKGYADMDSFSLHYAQKLSANPWINRFPVFVKDVRPLLNGDKLCIIDKNKKQIPIKINEDATWKLIALSGGHPINVFGEWDGKELFVLSITAEDRFVHFTAVPLERKKPQWSNY